MSEENRVLNQNPAKGLWEIFLAFNLLSLQVNFEKKKKGEAGSSY